jgi:hypothetical protein
VANTTPLEVLKYVQPASYYDGDYTKRNDAVGACIACRRAEKYADYYGWITCMSDENERITLRQTLQTSV